MLKKDSKHSPLKLAREIRGVMKLLEMLPTCGPVAAFGPVVDEEMSIADSNEIIARAQKRSTPFDELDDETAVRVYESMSSDELFESIVTAAIPQEVLDRVLPAPIEDNAQTLASWESIDDDFEDFDHDTNFESPY